MLQLQQNCVFSAFKMLFINVSDLIQMDKISHESLEIVLDVGLKDEEVAVK